MSEITTWPGWECVRQLGAGSFGRVYEIERDKSGFIEKAALKVITIPHDQSDVEDAYSEGMDDASVTEYFRSLVTDITDECAIMSGLKGHSNIVSFEDHMEIEHKDGFGWDILIRMELLTPLQKYSSTHSFEESDVIKLGCDICKALEVCQMKGNIIHRDIKPQNIFISEFGDFKLGDFGIARTSEKTMASLTQRKGTTAYMAPEVYLNSKYGHTADIYSLAVVLYRFLNANRTPFMPMGTITASDREHALMRRFSGEAVPAPVHGSEALKQTVLKALEFDPTQRYQTATEFRLALEQCIGVAERKTEKKEDKREQEENQTERTEYGFSYIHEGKEESQEEKEKKEIVEENVDQTVMESPDLVETDGPDVVPMPKSIGKRILAGILAVVLVMMLGVGAMNLDMSWMPPRRASVDSHADITNAEPDVAHGQEDDNQSDMTTETKNNDEASSDKGDEVDGEVEDGRQTSSVEDDNGATIVDIEQDEVGPSAMDNKKLWENLDRGSIRSVTFYDSLVDEIGKDTWDVSANNDGSVVAWITEADIDHRRIYANYNGMYNLHIAGQGGVLADENCSHMFAVCWNIISIDGMELFDTSCVTDMSYMFCDCHSLESIDVSMWNTANVTDMSDMFNGCEGLSTLSLENWDTSNVTDMHSMFYVDPGEDAETDLNLKEIGLSDWDTSKVKDMSNMFAGRGGLESLDLGTWDVSSVSDMSGMFWMCENMRTIDVGEWNTSNVTDMNSLFAGCCNLEEINVGSWDISSVKHTDFMFDSCVNLGTIDVREWDTSNVTSMIYMFYNCRNLVKLDVSKWNISSLENASAMFSGTIWEDDPPIK